MGLLDGGVQRLMGGIFGAIFPEARLHFKESAEDAGGSRTTTFTGLGASAKRATKCKAQRDRVTQTIRDAEGYAEGDALFVILTTYNGIGLPELPAGTRMTWPWPGGSLYSIEAPIDLDAARSHWIARGVPVR